MRQRQHWKTINLDKRCEIPGALSLKRLLSDQEQSAALLERLRPLLPTARLRKLNRKIHRQAKHVHDPAAGLGAISIPAELLLLIFECIEDHRDVASLCLSNKALWWIGFEYLTRAIQAQPDRWQGDRILCLGSRSTDLPEGVLTPADEAAMEADTKKHGMHPWRTPSEFFHQHLPDCSKPPSDTVRRARNRVYSGQWALCNVSKRQYVRAEGLPKVGGRQIHFGDVLLSQICWSSDPLTSMKYEGNLNRGAWAGDRFAITTLHELEARSRQEPEGTWLDVSGDVMKTVVDVYRP